MEKFHYILLISLPLSEWLNLVVVLLIPLLIGIYTIVNNNQQATIAQQNRQADINNQLDQQRESTLKTYEDDMSNLLLDRQMHTSLVWISNTRPKHIRSSISLEPT